jgi:putative nucleotidyltransferase with HDIG domain
VTDLPATVISADRNRGQGARWRVRQFLNLLGSRPDSAVDLELRLLLGAEQQWRLMARLAPFDRAHHLRVHQLLLDVGHNDPDLLRAALLHDVGKADERGRVTAIHRAVHVTLRRVSPSLVEWVAARGNRFTHGIWLACRHAQVGARMARDAGASTRCAELIERHEDTS